MITRTAWTIAISVSLMAMTPLGATTAAGANPERWPSANRDNSGTRGGAERSNGSQRLCWQHLTSRVSFQAEGTGLEPAFQLPCASRAADN